MRWWFIASTVGIFLIILGLTMILPLLVSYHYQDGSHLCFIPSIAITAATGFFLLFLSKGKEKDSSINQKEGMVTVALAWTAIGFFGSLPFLFSPFFHSFTDAFFESVSGFTTTGASILTDIESVSKSLLLWRSLIQWLGGMGIIVLSLAVLPFLGVGGIQLYKAEVPSPVPDKLTPRLSDSAKILWIVYAVLTLLMIIFLLGGGMSLYDAVCHALTTMPTGGFSTKNASLGHYDSLMVEYTVIIFMILAGINFSLHFQMIRGKTLIFWKDTECRVFLLFLLIMILLMTWNTYGSNYDSFHEAFRFAGFQLVSIITTTGYTTADYEFFPGLSKIILFCCMFIGACAGSTGGGIKFSRIIITLKFCYREFFTIIHPRSVKKIKMNNLVVPNEVLRQVMAFIAIYFGIFVLGCVILGLMGLDMLTCFGAVSSSLGNVGPGFGTVGPSENYAHLPAAAKWVLSFCMLLGRLEIYTLIILLIPEFWRK
jgi:trk system potassium uptake protein